MWTCSKCKEVHEDGFDACWNCGAGRDGTKGQGQVESVSKSEKRSETAKSSNSGLNVFIGGIIVAVIILYFGGWSIVWQQHLTTAKAFFFHDHGFAIRFNELYYGAIFTNRFFDSPAISWLCMMIATGSTGGIFVFTNSGSE